MTHPRFRLGLASVALLVSPVCAQATFAELHAEHLPPDSLFAQMPAVGDLDRDGQLDLIAWEPTGRFGFLRLDGTGDARFRSRPTQPLPLPAGGPLVSHRIGDLDGDGWPEVFARRNLRSYLWWNDGAGELLLSPRADLPNPGEASVRIADFDRDGRAEILTASAWLEHDGADGLIDRAAQKLPPLPPSTYGFSLLSADIDADGDLDLLVDIRSTLGAPVLQRVEVWWNDGAGSFAVGPSVPGATGPRLLADLDRDGKVDFISKRTTDAASWVHLGDGRGGFSPTYRLGADFAEFALVDVEGDGTPELACSVLGTASHGGIYRFDPAFGFTRGAPSWPGRGGIGLLSPGDLDGDGREDLVVQHVGLLLSRGDGSFAVASGPAIPGAVPSTSLGIIVRDADGDGVSDLIIRGWVLSSDGRGSFDRHHPSLSSDVNYPRSVDWDIDADGDLDLLQFGSEDRARVLLRTGASLVVAHTFLMPELDRVDRTAVLDLDGDGACELVGVASNYARVFAGSPQGMPLEISAHPLLPELQGASDVVTADFDGNGLPDIAKASGTLAPVTLLLQEPAGAFRAVALPASFSAYRLHVADMDADGRFDLLCDGQMVGSGLFLARQEIDSTFTKVPIETPGLGGAGLFLGDFDLDGHLDVLFSLPKLPWLPESIHAIAYGDGRRGLTPWRAIEVSASTNWVTEVADIDGDGDLDLLVDDTAQPAGILAVDILFNRARHLALPHLVQAGREFAVEFHARPGAGGAPRVGYSALGRRALPTAVGVSDLGSWQLDLSDAIVLPPVLIPPGSGVGRIAWIAPPLPALRGQSVFVQGVVLDAEIGFHTTGLVGREVR